MNFPVKISYKSFEGMRTISQNALFHMWCQETAQFFVKNGKMTFADGSEMIKENVKRNLKQTFLGEELVESVNLKTGEITQRMELRHTSKLEKGEMHHFMTQIEMWALEWGIPLTHPADSEYMTLKESQTR